MSDLGQIAISATTNLSFVIENRPEQIENIFSKFADACERGVDYTIALGGEISWIRIKTQDTICMNLDQGILTIFTTYGVVMFACKADFEEAMQRMEQIKSTGCKCKETPQEHPAASQ